jgi:hypothetical protein
MVSRNRETVKGSSFRWNRKPPMTLPCSRGREQPRDLRAKKRPEIRGFFKSQKEAGDYAFAP